MAVVTLGGKTVLDGPCEWAQTNGVRHHEAEFELIPEDAEALVAGGLEPITLVMQSPGADGAEFRYLYAIEDRPAENRHTKMVRVVDRRWFWPFVHVNRAFNVRRNVGVKRVKAGFNRPELDPLEPKIRYAPWSIKLSAPWTAEDALKEVWKSVSSRESEATGESPPLTIDPDISKFSKDSLPLENMELADDGAAAIKRMLDYIPGAEITVDPDGTVRIFSIADGGEADIVGSLPAEQDGGGHVEFVTNGRIRPSAINVLFAPEVELRLDYEESTSDFGGTSSGDGDDPKDPLQFYNVLPVPDYELGNYAQGTWLSIGQAVSLWGSVPNFGKLTRIALRRGLVPYMDLWTGLRIAGIADAKADWGARIAALQQHYRRTYRISYHIVARARSLRAYRVATINPSTGSRAPSTAYHDWAVVATQRFLAVALGGGSTDFAYATNFDGYPDGGKLDSNAKVAPSKVTMVDPDQGIFHLDLQADMFRVHEQFLPSKIDNIPTGSLKGGLIAWNSLEPNEQPPALSASHKVITVITVVPGSPNSEGRLLKLTRKPGDVADMLPSTLSAGITDANGPEMDVFIGPGWETARFAWVDDDRKRIIDALALDDPAGTPVAGKKLVKGNINNISDLCINLGKKQGKGDTAASLDAIANAVAASIYAGYADRYEGERTSPVTHKARVQGFVERVIHSVAPSGEATSRVVMAEGRQAPLDLMSMMPTSTRHIILKTAQAGKI